MTNQTTRKMTVLMLASICSAVPQIGTGFAQNPYTICIGDLCHSPSYINLGCSFAGSHKDSTDEDAAKLVCMVREQIREIHLRPHGDDQGRQVRGNLRSGSLL
jgi:hypothetical protein